MRALPRVASRGLHHATRFGTREWTKNDGRLATQHTRHHESEVIFLMPIGARGRALLVILACMLSMALCFSRSALAASWASIGVKAGVSIADQTIELGSDEIATSPRVGASVAGFLERPLSGHWGLLAEIHYLQRGMRIEVIETTPTGEEISSSWLSNRVDYLTVPLLIKYVVVRGPVRPYVAAGPRLDIRLGSSCDQFRSMPTGWCDVYDDLQSVEVGTDFVVGMDTRWLLVEGRYNHSFIDSLDREHFSLRNRSFEIVIGRRLLDL